MSSMQHDLVLDRTALVRDPDASLDFHDTLSMSVGQTLNPFRCETADRVRMLYA